MLDLDYKEIIDIVEDLQYEIYESTGGIEYYLLDATFCNGVCIINFLDIQIWNSEDDMREYIEEEDEYENLEKYLRREINQEIQKLSLIKL